MPKSSGIPLLLKGIILLCIAVVLLALNLHYHVCYQTTLSDGEYIRDGSSVLKANNWSVPIVYDWDSDEKKDLLVGNSYIDEENIQHGHVAFYKNIGSDAAPEFNGAVYIHACADESSPLKVSAFG